MPLRRLHLVLDPDLGPALWVREQTGPGRSRALEDLSALREGPLAGVLEHAPDRLRHRVRTGERRVPALPLEPAALLALVGAVAHALRERLGEGFADRLPDLVADHTAARLGEELVAMPELLGAVLLDDRAREAVAARALRVRTEERFGRPVLRWRALDPNASGLEHALVDARARTAFLEHLRAAPAPTEDRHGVLWALAEDAELQGADVPAQRRITAAFDAFVDSARPGVRLGSSESELVVRLFQPPLGAAWPLQTCLREPDGTVHPVADLRAVGDLSAAGAAEASAEVLRLAPTVRDAAVDETGVDWLLTTAQAGAFLAADTPALEQAGVTVLLPRDWTRQRTVVRATAEEGDQQQKASGSGVGLSSMATFRWRVAVGDMELTEEEMQQIREAQSELVALRGQWVRLDPTTLRAAERFLDAFARRGTAPPPQFVRAAPTGASAAETPFEVVGEARWTDLFAQLLSPEAAELDAGIDRLLRSPGAGLLDLLPGGPGAPSLPPPTTLDATLRPYQQDGLDWLWALDRLGLGGILADDMGLGKTMQVLSLLCREREEQEKYEESAGTGPVGPTLLVCPMSVVGAWQREAARFAPHLAVHVHHGGDRVRDESFIAGAADLDVVITTYSLLARDLPVLSAVPWHRIVLDEAQHVKTPGTQVTRAARSLRATHRLALTGTPVENRLGDLHALMEVVNPGLLGPAAAFRELIATPIEEEGDESALARLKLVTGPFVLRRVKTDRAIIQDLPEKVELTQVVNLTPEQAGLYQALVDELMTEIRSAAAQGSAGSSGSSGPSDAVRRAKVVSTITRLKQVCNHPAHYLDDGSALLREGEHRSGKLELVDDVLGAALAEGEKVLVFTQFTSFGRLLVPYWEERFAEHSLSVPFLHGGVSKRDRDAMVAEFQAQRDRPGVMLLSLRAGGTGLTLTAANHVIHLDRWWNPAVENQATDRAFRIGQRRDVTVHKLVSAGTVEERIDAVLADKQALADRSVSTSGEDWLADLDPRSLERLLSLSEEERP
ncbi:DEAD/DEAH box helicase [Brachybacterium sp. J153]|uniref:DEAD/DEAH box helicase n=1 Tax=Brachybacterium sp. J153 TaxID=3116488 RepID=UPI002E798CFD|nr:DEAD/DEAH box helicase [Brachybacterium sp. J153]MEE1619532.1 DEAD/DEAH box helicase [Brachybacterium sp. J153]